MLNKIFFTIVLLCGIASASALDYVNRNLCNIKNNKYDVTITCTPRVNEFDVRKIKLTLQKDLSECIERFVYTDGSYAIRKVHFGLSSLFSYDEFGVEKSQFYSKEDTKAYCSFLYNAYKEAAKRW